MKFLLNFFLAYLRAFSPFFFPSNLQPFGLREAVAHGAINPYPNGHFRFFGKLNAAGRKRKTNRLHLSRNTRNKHR